VRPFDLKLLLGALRKGNPIERWGRKAQGPSRELAGLPNRAARSASCAWTPPVRLPKMLSLQREALQREHLLGELVAKTLGKPDYFTTVIVRISVLALKTKGNERSYASP
jgi:hypothetical protein